MSQPEEATPQENFLGSLAGAPARVLLLDYDGTLAPFQVERDRATPYEGVREAVKSILSSGRTRVVIISGRQVTDLRRLLGVEPPPELWGTHGWERLERGGPHRLRALPPEAEAALKRAGAMFAPELHDRVEIKPASVALHVRGLTPSDAERVLAFARSEWEVLGTEGGLDVYPFDGGLELRVCGWDKGDAVRAVLSDEPEGTAVTYLGDDLTDEDAFRALGDLASSGRVNAFCVLVREEARASLAATWLRPPVEMLEFLRCWREAMG